MTALFLSGHLSARQTHANAAIGQRKGCIQFQANLAQEHQIIAEDRNLPAGALGA
jgi:hypothetical protein